MEDIELDNEEEKLPKPKYYADICAMMPAEYSDYPKQLLTPYGYSRITI